LVKFDQAEQMHVRSTIATAAAVSAGNVTKVKQLNKTCVPDLITALYNDEISIHWARQLPDESLENQLEALAPFRFEKHLLVECDASVRIMPRDIRLLPYPDSHRHTTFTTIKGNADCTRSFTK
jgi:hypothetical protein